MFFLIMKRVCFVFVFLFLTSCASDPKFVKSLEKDQVDLKAYFPAGPAFYLDKIFKEGDVENYDIKVTSFYKNVKSKENYEKTHGKKGNYDTDASYDIEASYQIVITDKSGNVLMDKVFTSSVFNVESYAFGLERNQSESRAKRNCISKGKAEIKEKIAPLVIYAVKNNEHIVNAKKLDSYDIKNKFKYAFENSQILICDKMRLGISDDKLDGYASDLAKDVREDLSKYFKNIKIVSKYSFIKSNQIIIDIKSINIKESNADDAYRARGGYVILKADIDVNTYESSKTFTFEGVGRVEESAITFLPQQILGVATLGYYSKAQAGAYKLVSGGRARDIVATELTNKIIFNTEYQSYMQKMELGSGTTPEVKMMSSTFPLSLALSFPPDIEKLEAEGHFARAISLNNDLLGGTVSEPIGKKIKEKITGEFVKRFEKVTDVASEKERTGYNPLDVSCNVDIQIRDVDFSTNPTPRISLWGQMMIYSSTGDLFEKVDFSSSGDVSSSDDDSVFNGTIGGLLRGNAFTQGFMYQKQFDNGCKDLVDMVVEKCMKEFDSDDFLARFSEFSAYSFAKKSNNINELKGFMNNYVDSIYSVELGELLEIRMYELAVNSKNIEAYYDYFDHFSEGTHYNEIMTDFEDSLFEEIKVGNVEWCTEYKKYFDGESRIEDVLKYCGHYQ